jgi:hypothetical protein
MRSYRLRRPLAVAGLSLGAGLMAAVPSPAMGACKPKHAHTIAKHGGSALYSRATGPEDEYGRPTTLYGCTRGQRRAARLEHFDSGFDPAFTNVSFAGHWVTFDQTVTDIVCTKYDPGNPKCTSHKRLSFNLRTGKRRADAARLHGGADRASSWRSASDQPFRPHLVAA